MISRILRIFLSIILISISIVCAYAAINTSVSLKYEVDEGYIALEMNKALPQEQKANEILELDKKGKNLRTIIFILWTGAALSLGSIILVNMRKKAKKITLVPTRI